MVDLTRTFGPGGFKAGPPPTAPVYTDENPRSGFFDELRSYGFVVKGLPVLGKIERVAVADDKGTDQSGWYVFNEFPDDFRPGASIGIGVFGNWKGHPEKVTWTSKRSDAMSPAEIARRDEYITAARIARENEQREQRSLAQAKANTIWSEATPAPADHPYLVRKGIGPHDVRVSRGKLVIPMAYQGEIVSLQFIDAEGNKRFLKHGQMLGSFFSIGQPTDTIYVTEGFATGASIHEATGDMVYIVYNTANLLEGTASVKALHPDAEIVIAGDDDQWGDKGNAGRAKASAAGDVHMCRVIFPEFDKTDSKPTDFNDLAQLEGIEAVKAQLKSKPAPNTDRLEYIWSSNIQPNNKCPYIIKGLFEPGSMSVVFGQSNVGKSFFAVDIGIHVAAGIPYRERRVAQGGVVYVASESGASVKRRVFAALKDKHLNDIPLAIVPTSVDLLDKEADTPRLVAAVLEAGKERGKISLVIVDTLSRSFGGGDENSSKDMTTFISNMDKLRDATGAHVLIVHHAGKDGARGARGHSSLRAATDTEISIKRASGGKFSIASIDKQRDGDSGDKLQFELHQVELGVDDDGDPITTCVVIERNADTNSGLKLGPQQNLCLEILIEHWASSVISDEGISFDDFKVLMVNGGLIEEDDKRLRQKLSELRKGLRAHDLITINARRVKLSNLAAT